MFEYDNLTEDELLQLAVERDELTEEARLALDTELSRRRIGSDEIKVLEAEARAAREKEENLSVSNLFRGANKEFYGKGTYTHDVRNRVEEFDTTLWFVVFYFPLIPLGSYRIRRRFRSRWNIFASETVHVVRQLPRYWEQILLTWIKASAVLLALRLVLFYVLEYVRS